MKKSFFLSLLLPVIGYALIPINFVYGADAYILETPLVGGQTSISGPAQYIRVFFIFGLGLVGIAALFAIVFGGIRYMASGSSETGKTEGKRWIIGALSGIILLFSSYLILGTINPDLVSLKEPNLPTIEINIPEPPAQAILNLGQQTGILPGQLTFSNPKYPDMEQRFNATAPNNLRQVVSSLPFPTTITSYDQGSGHAPNSDHYQSKALDIYIGNMTDDQVRTLMTYLDNNPNVSKTINGRLPELNYFNGSPHDYDKNRPGTVADHQTHIHVSVY